MTDIVQFRTESGTTVYIEADSREAGGVQRTARGGAMVAEASASLDQALSAIRPAVESMLADLKAMVSAPDKVALEFGVKLSASLGALIAKGSGEANIKVTLEWSSKS